MSKKKGLSLEEKRRRMLEMFYEKMDFFNLKEVERMASKEKGITSMAVKDVLQSLVDDNMVDTEKIGTSNYYWAFPSKGLQVRKRKLGEMEEELDTMNKKMKQLEESIEEAKDGREETDDREELVSTAAELEATKTKLDSELMVFRECDPDVIDAKRASTKVSTEAANRWTDNVFSIRSWVKNKFNMDESLLNKQFEIPADLDYVE